MNREIKFRAWDKFQEKLIPAEQVMHIEFDKDGIKWIGCWVVVADNEGNPEQGLHQIERENLELMQYTGLKDKNGKEIYEGDIVYHVEDVVVEVISGHERKEQECIFTEIKIPDIYLQVGGNLPDIDELEIIGNIYEDTELIK
jgi:uncharacterized phage protein (TIGR01671 family)